MEKMSTDRIERLAVRAIESEADNPSYFLRPEISEGDKGISFDGEIHVFKDSSETVESLIGSVPVQVKGTQVKEFSSGNRSFSLEMGHYRNYYDKNGVLVLVVEIKDNKNKKIYYKQLLSKELNMIIDNYNNQKTKTIELRPLDETSLRIVCKRFIDERKKQPTVLVENNVFNDSEFTSYELSSLTFNPNKLSTSDVFDHYFTVYGIKDSLKVPIHYTKFDSLATMINENITINKKIYNFNMNVITQSSQVIFNIEGALILQFKKNVKKNNLSFEIFEFQSLHTQLKIIPFLIDLLNSDNVSFQETSFSFEGIKGQERYTKALKKTYSILEDLRKVFLEIGIDEKKILQKKNSSYPEFIMDMEALIKAILFNDITAINIPEKDLPRFIRITFGNIFIILLYNPFSDKKFINAFSKEALNIGVYFEVENKKFRHSPYLLLNDEFSDATNVNFEIIKKSFDKFNPIEDEPVFSRTNEFCLKCLRYYDISLNLQLLDLIEYVYNRGFPNSSINMEIYTINKLQARLRKEKTLNDEDYQLLLQLKEKSKENIELQFCASVLLESRREADMYFRQLEKERQELYRKFPIFTLYQRLLEN